VDDFEPFLEVAREVITAAPGFEPAREVTSGAEALVTAAELEPELMIVDIHMPGMSGTDVARTISATHPSVVVILISAVDPTDVAADASECGAACIVRKQDFGPKLLARLWRTYGHGAGE
jgi:DNA-binding NarL/FixJ family response regulator